MYDNYYHQGKSLAEWASVLKNEFTLGELYRMAKDGCDFNRFALEVNGVIESK